MPSYTSSEFWIGERRNIRYSALDERESATATKKKKAPEKQGDYQEEESGMKGEREDPRTDQVPGVVLGGAYRLLSSVVYPPRRVAYGQCHPHVPRTLLFRPAIVCLFCFFAKNSRVSTCRNKRKTEMKNKNPYSVLELCEEFASETIEFARFFESAFNPFVFFLEQSIPRPFFDN